MKPLGDPFCSACGYQLSGAITSANCPECGLALVDVLERKPTENSAHYKRYSSKATWFGLPLVDIAYGPDPGEKVGKARGIIAIGDHATGFIAIGGVARGGLAIGGIAYGGVALGGVAVGVIGANGGMALAGLAAMGGMAFSGYFALGGMAFGHIGHGGLFITLW